MLINNLVQKVNNNDIRILTNLPSACNKHSAVQAARTANPS